jgi:hypothetical protein
MWHGTVPYLKIARSMPSLWKAGRITGRMEALMEDAPQTFKSFVGAERIPALPEA